jgi:hypothetical protein
MSTLSGGPNIVTDGLVLHLDAANVKSYVSGSTTWNDISRGGNNGTLINGPTFNSANGGSIVFDGVNDFVNLGTTIDNSLTWTMNSWFNTTLNTNDHRSLIGNSGTSPTGVGKFMGITNDGSQYRKPWTIVYNSGGNQLILYGTTTIIANTWYNMTVTHSGTEINMYLNGTLNRTPTTISGYSPSNNITSIGLQRAIFWPFPGTISQTQIYNRALSAQEVLQNYNTTKTRFGL